MMTSATNDMKSTITADDAEQPKRRRAAWIAGAAILGLMASGATPALADSDKDADVVAEAVDAVAPTDLSALSVQQSGEELTASFLDGGEIATGVDAIDGLTFVSADGSQSTTVTLPGAAALDTAAVSEDGSITYVGDEDAPSVNILPAPDAVRVSTVISSAQQPDEFDYDFGSEATVEIQPDGGALVLVGTETESTASRTEQIVASIAAPWATDAAGVPIETYYVAEGGTLTQVVKHQDAGVAYPVVADPTFDSPNVVQVRVRFNRAETAAIAAGGWGGVVGSFSCGAMAAVCVLASGTLAYRAGVAQNSSPKRCVQVTASSPVIIPGIYWWVDNYSGGPCR